jgi:NADH-quinone oxidoreductase subunit N
LINAFRIEATLVILALITLITGVLRPTSSRVAGYVLAACVFGLMVYVMRVPVDAPDATGVYRLDEFAVVFKELCLLASSGVLILAAEGDERFGKSTTEHYVLILLAAAGMLAASTARDFVLLFVALELLTTASYVLVGFSRKDPKSIEASVKYLCVGALSTAFLAYGISYVFGATSSTSYDVVRQALAAGEPSMIALIGVTFVIAGIAFKIAIFPGHMWAADVYEGAPLAVSAFLAVASKMTGFAVLLRLLLDAFEPLHAHWAPVILVLAAVTILWGNIGALRQTELKRMLGYSSMAHSGYLLLGTVALNALGVNAILYYLVQYLFTNLACFFVLGVLAKNGEGSTLADLSGLNRRAPFLSWALIASMLSMAGIPPLSGFLAKYMVFAAVPDYSGYDRLYFTVLALALVGVVISVVYYFGIIRVMWTDNSTDTAKPARVKTELNAGLGLGGALAVCVAAMVVLGVYQTPVLDVIGKASASLGLH